MGSSKKQTVGYWYHPGFHLVMHHGPFDAFLRFRGGDVDAWDGQLTSSGTIHIDAAELWGGEDSEGGIQGDVDIMFGDADQLPNSNIETCIGADGSAHRGHAGLLFRGGRYGAMNPYPKAVSVLTLRALKGWDDDAPWYPDTAAVPMVGEDGTPPTWIGGDFGTFFIGPRVNVTSPIEGFNEFTQALADQYDLDYDPVTGDSELLYFWRPNESGLMYSKREEGTDFDQPMVVELIDRGWQPNTTALIRFWSVTGLHMCVFTLGATSDAPPAPEGYGWEESAEGPMSTPMGTVRLWFSSEFLRRSGGFYAMNPAHIIYDSLTAASMQGEPAALINDASFRAAADQLYAESFGLCVSYDADQESVEEFRARICNTIGASCTRSTVNGQWYLDLVRGDYDLETLPVLTDDDILDFQMEPTVLDDAVNQLCVKWFDPMTKQERTTAPVQALGAIESTGRINAQTIEYLSLPAEGLALRVATRELQSRITPLKRFTLRTNRVPYSWRRGTYFRLQTPKRGIADMVCLVGDIGKGTLRSGAISLVALQDVFSFPMASYVTGHPPVPPPSTTPVPVENQVAFEAPFVELVGTLAAAELAALDGEAGFLMAAGARPSAGNNYQLNTTLTAGTFESAGTFDWCPSATVVEAAGPLDTDFTLADGTDLARVTVGTAALWGSEMCRVDALDVGALTLTLGRGCGDTVPAMHDSGERIYFYDEWASTDQVEYVTGETVEAKLLTRTGTAMLALPAAPTMAVTFDQRAARPYPPGNVLINGEAYPEEIDGDVEVTWAHRDRHLQADQLVDTTAGDIGPEAGTTYTVEYFTEAGTTPLDSETGITGTAATPWTAPADGRYRIELSSLRDALVSWQRYTHVLQIGEPPPLPTPLDPMLMSIATKLVSWWDFDGDLADRFGVNSLSGTVSYDTGHISQKAIKSTRATKSAAARLPTMTGATPGAISFGGWVYVVGTGGEDIELRTTTNQAYRLAVRTANQAHLIVGDSTGSVTISSAVGAVALNQWAFLVGTIDGPSGQMKLYVGDTLVATGTATDLRNPTIISFGRQIGDVFNALHNDASFVCDGVLSADEVAYLYNSGAGRPGSDFPILPRTAWTWFNDPRQLVLPSGRILLGGVGSDDGTIKLSWTDDVGATWGSFNLALGDPVIDDHDNPGLLRRDDGYLLAFFCRHNAASFFLSTSTSPDDPTAFARVDLDSQLGGGPYAYANPFQLTGESGSPIFVFYRSGTTPTWSTYYSKSLDGGATWAAQTRLLDGAASSGRPYFKAAQNGTDRIDFAVTDGHPNAVATNGIRHFYYQGGNFYSSDGTLLGVPPFDTATDLTAVYDGSTTRAWVWDIQIDSAGRPIIVFATFPSSSDHRYHYARWTGSAWDVHEICAAGGALYAGEPYYSGGVSLDPADPRTVYASRESGGTWRLYRYHTTDGGASFTEEALPPFEDAIRPIGLRGTGLIAAIAGRYTTFNNFAMRPLIAGGAP